VMGLLRSRCKTCGKSVSVVYDDQSLETLLVDRTCDCPAAKLPKVVPDSVRRPSLLGSR